jgi:hypothetical protein
VEYNGGGSIVGKVFNGKACDTCGTVGKVIETWGKMYCRSCWDKKPKRGHGCSGMVAMPESDLLRALAVPIEDKSLHLEKTTKGNKIYASLYLSHYPGSYGIVGRQCNYFVYCSGYIAGIIGANSPPLYLRLFGEYFGEEVSNKNYMNNNVFRLIVREKNLGTRVLKLFRNRVRVDYESRYHDELVGLVTFVEPPRTGAVYKADNWTYLGLTQGKKCMRRGDHGKWINKEWTTGTKKLAFARLI